MTNWWLRLYTIPALKKILRAWVIVLIGNLALGLLSLQLLEIGVILNLYVLWVTYKGSEFRVGTNIEFHKTHVPFASLRRAHILDPLLRILFASSVICLGIFLSGLFASWSSDVVLNQILYFTGALIYFLFLGGMKSLGTNDYELISHSYPNNIKLNFTYVVLIIVSAATFLLGLALDFKAVFLLVFGVLGLMISQKWYLFRAVFHQAQRKGNIGNLLKYTFRGMGTSALIYVLLMLGSRSLVHVAGLPLELKVLTVELNGVFTPELDVSTARELLIHSRNSPDTARIIYETSPELSRISVQALFPKGDMHDHFYYASYSLNPSVENMTYILEQLQKAPEYKAIHEATAQMVHKKWPKTQPFPDHLIAKKMIKNEVRLPASEP